MFVMSEAEVAAIRAAYEQSGELSAAVELRRRFPGIASTAQAREWARIIASWQPLPDARRSGEAWLALAPAWPAGAGDRADRRALIGPPRH